MSKAENWFEGSYLGSKTLPEETRMECKICWYIYDPAVGDDYWQILPGTPFSALPLHWHCPECDGDKNHFMVKHDD